MKTKDVVIKKKALLLNEYEFLKYMELKGTKGYMYIEIADDSSNKKIFKKLGLNDLRTFCSMDYRLFWFTVKDLGDIINNEELISNGDGVLLDYYKELGYINREDKDLVRVVTEFGCGKDIKIITIPKDLKYSIVTDNKGLEVLKLIK